MGKSTGNADKKSTTTNKNDKTEEERWNTLGRKEMSNSTRKTNNTTQGNKPEVTGERRKIKKISRQDKTIQRKQNIRKHRNKILPASRGECTNTYQQPDDK